MGAYTTFCMPVLYMSFVERQHTGMLQLTQPNSAFPVKLIVVKHADIAPKLKGQSVSLNFTCNSQE